MKNTCPKCGTAYNVSPAVVGRKFTCKNCGTPVVVTPDGLDYQNAPEPEPPTEAAASGAFDFDAEGARPARAPAPPRAPEDEPADDFDALPARKARRAPGGGGGKLTNFLLFREFIAPLFVKLLFVAAVLFVLLGALGVVVAAVISGKSQFMLGAVVYLCISVPTQLLMARIMCELMLLGFAAYDRLGEIKSLLEKGQAVTPAAPPGPPGF